MKILITGSSGFIGYHLSKRLLSDGHKVSGLDNHNDYYDYDLKKTRYELNICKDFTFYNLDLNEIDSIEDTFDIAINLAAQPGVRIPKKFQHLYNETNIVGFESFCNFCLKKDIKNVIYASSSSVYGEYGNQKLNEKTTPTAPKSLYAESKLRNELYAEEIHKKYGISLIGLRFFTVYGPYGRPDMAYYRFSKSLLMNKKLTLNNKGLMARDMTYIEDIIDGIIGAITLLSHSRSIGNEIFNLGNQRPIKTLDLLNIIERKLNLNANIIHKQTRNESFCTHADISKAKKLLGYNPKTEIESGIDHFLEWYKKYEK